VQRRGGRSDDALGADAAALEIDRGGVFDGPVGSDLAGDARRGIVALIGVAVRLVKLRKLLVRNGWLSPVLRDEIVNMQPEKGRGLHLIKLPTDCRIIDIAVGRNLADYRGEE
jgi:hypothetical protein